MRKGEILKLKWENVDFINNIILLEDTKNRERREIPINSALLETLKDFHEKRQSDYVFCDEKGKPFGDVKRSFKSALKRAGIHNFRFHDLRHTFASHLVMAGKDINTV